MLEVNNLINIIQVLIKFGRIIRIGSQNYNVTNLLLFSCFSEFLNNIVYSTVTVNSCKYSCILYDAIQNKNIRFILSTNNF